MSRNLGDVKARIVAFLLVALASPTSAIAAESVKVYAAASLTNVLRDLASDYERQTGTTVVLVFAGSSTLANQIEHGAPADVFVSADGKWMDYLAEHGRIIAATRRNLVGNELVLVAPSGRAFKVEMNRKFDFAAAFAGKLCSGNTEAVPAGIYARQALTALGWWDAIAARIVGSEDVRSALAFVERGECGAGIVYATDARIAAKVEVVAVFPASSHEPIVYPGAVVDGATGDARAFLDFLGSDAARTIFTRHGFRVEPEPGAPAQ